jgi:hypothetical protein
MTLISGLSMVLRQENMIMLSHLSLYSSWSRFRAAADPDSYRQHFFYIHDMFSFTPPRACSDFHPATCFASSIKIRDSKKRSPGRYSHERVQRADIGPIHRQGMQAAIFPVMKPDPVLPPVLTVRDEFEFLLVQWIIGMGYSEISILNVAMRRI